MHYISCAADGFQAELEKCETVKHSEEKEANTCVERRVRKSL